LDQPPTVLAIDDETAVRRGIRAYLEDSGFRVVEADGGALGVDLFRRHRPDVVLCDLRMPGMDGLEVVSTLAAESPETPVIVVSGVSLVSEAVQALKQGAWDFVTKPIQDMEVVESAVRRALDRARLMHENLAYREDLEALNRDLRRALRQYREDQEAGRKTQSQLLPQDNRRFRGYRLTRRLYPSRHLSGDFVDYFSIDERRVVFYMADVSGHGAASAFVTVMLKTLVDQYAEAYRSRGDDTVLSPARTLARLDQDLRRQHLDKYLTMFYGVVDADQNRLTCGSGGQFPYPILYDGREARSLAFAGRPVGLFEDSRFHDHPVPLPGAFRLVLISDGILELLPGSASQARQEALCALVGRCAADIDGVTAGLGLEAQTLLPDDVAVLMVSREPGGG
jgi:serine phosphatase RsbU (regulator of sigma subunit)